jgi:hypothetical protein
MYIRYIQSLFQSRLGTADYAEPASTYLKVDPYSIKFLTYVKIQCLGLILSSGQSSWLQIQRYGFYSRRYQIFREVVGLERGPLSLVSTIEELLGRTSSGLDLENRDYGRRGSGALITRHSSIRKSLHYIRR